MIDHLEADLLLEPAALRADLDERHVRAVVDVERRVVDAAAGRGDRRPVAGCRTVPLRMLCRGTDASAESRRIAISLRPISSEKKIVGMSCLIAAARAKSSAERRLTEGGTGGDDDQLAGVQAVGELVELGEAGGHAGHLAVAAAGRLDLVDRRRRPRR